MPHKRKARFRIPEGGPPDAVLTWIKDQLTLFADGEAQVTIRRPQRTTRQNSYYWGVVIETIRKAILAAGQPIRAKDLHEHFKAKYLAASAFEYVDRETGEVREVVRSRSTTDLDTTEMHDYIELIRHDELVVETLGVYIPDPGEDYDFTNDTAGAGS